MTKLNLIALLFFFASNLMFCQESTFATVKTNTTEVKIPGNWEQMNTMDDSGQTYLRNKEGIVIAIAQNPKKAYSFFKDNKSDFENVKLFYEWDSDYRKENKFKTEKIKEDAKQEYIIWKYNEDKIDNVFLFGSVKNNFLNLLVYTTKWSEAEKISFLERLYKLNK